MHDDNHSPYLLLLPHSLHLLLKYTHLVLCTHIYIHTFHFLCLNSNTVTCLPLSVASYNTDIVHHELIGQCQSEVRAAAASSIYSVSSCQCLFILNLIVDGSIRVEWGEPVQFNDNPSRTSSHGYIGQHAWWGGGCGDCMSMSV